MSIDHSKRICSPIVFAIVVMTFGCGQEGRRGIPIAAVTGTVHLQGKPLPEGVVTFFSTKNGIAASTPIREDGTFHIEDGIEIGPYLISVGPFVPLDNAGAPPAPSKKPKETTPIPKKYQVAETSGLTADVARGKNTFQFELN